MLRRRFGHHDVSLQNFAFYGGIADATQGWECVCCVYMYIYIYTFEFVDIC